MNDPKDLADMRALGEAVLAAALADRRHPARYVTFCTVTEAGPAARTVMLRGWDGRNLSVQTDGASAKVGEIAADPRVALVIWDASTDVQLRFSARAQIDVGASEDWDRMPPPARLNYGGAPAPGTPMGAAEDYVPGTDPSRFVIVSCAAQSWEVLHLGRHMHRRALFEWRGSDWAGTWIAP